MPASGSERRRVRGVWFCDGGRGSDLRIVGARRVVILDLRHERQRAAATCYLGMSSLVWYASTVSYSISNAAQDERSAAEFQAAKDAADEVKSEFVRDLPPGSPVYDLEWITRYGSNDRLIFVFSVVIDLDEDFERSEYPDAEMDDLTADLWKKIIGSKVDDWGVGVVTATARPKTAIR